MSVVKPEPVTFTSYDGVRLGGYRVDPSAASEPLPGTRVIVLAGAGATAEAYASAMPRLADQLGPAYVFNLRGHGYGPTRSEGGHDGVLWQTASDIPLLVEHVAEGETVILIGHSFSAVSVVLAQCGWHHQGQAAEPSEPRTPEIWRQHLCFSVLAGLPPLGRMGSWPSLAHVFGATLQEVISRTRLRRWRSNAAYRIARPYSINPWERLIFELQHYGGFLPLPTPDVVAAAMLCGMIRSWYDVHSADAHELARQLTYGVSWRVPVRALQKDLREMLTFSLPRDMDTVYVWGEHEIAEGAARAYLEHADSGNDVWGIYVSRTGHCDCLLNRAAPVAYTLRHIASHRPVSRLLKVS